MLKKWLTNKNFKQQITISTSGTIKRLLRVQSKIENNFILKNLVESYKFILIKVFDLQG